MVRQINTSKNINSDQKYYNSFLVVDKNLNFVGNYEKKKLVPFGEFLPFESFLNSFGLKKITYGYSSFSRGKGEPIINIKLGSENFKIFLAAQIIFATLPSINDLLPSINDQLYKD